MPAKTTKRHFTGTPVEMLTSAATILQAAQDHKADIIQQREVWKDPFIPNLQTKIDTTVSTWIGFNSANELTDATTVITNLQTQALLDLGSLRVQINRDFRKDTARRSQILSSLVFTTDYKKAQKLDQEALISQLFTIKKNINTAVRREFIEKGISESLLDTIINYSGEINNANISQESFKAKRPLNTSEANTAFNDIFDSVMDIATISADLFKRKKQPLIQDKFLYAKVLGSLNSYKARKATEKPKKTTTP